MLQWQGIDCSVQSDLIIPWLFSVCFACKNKWNQAEFAPFWRRTVHSHLNNLDTLSPTFPHYRSNPAEQWILTTSWMRLGSLANSSWPTICSSVYQYSLGQPIVYPTFLQLVSRVIGETIFDSNCIMPLNIWSVWNRCHVPDCDDPVDPVYENDWVHYAVPGKTDSSGVFTPEQCQYFASRTQSNISNICALDNFSDEVKTCDRWVYDKFEKTIVEEVSVTIPIKICFKMYEISHWNVCGRSRETAFRLM